MKMNWKPIKDDPPVGVALLVYHDKHGPCVGMFHPGPDAWMNMDGNYKMHGPPTHWCELTTPRDVVEEQDRE